MKVSVGLGVKGFFVEVENGWKWKEFLYEWSWKEQVSIENVISPIF